MARLFLILLALTLVDCTRTKNGIPYFVIKRADNFYTELKEKDENRNEILEDSRKIYKSEICDESKSCISICKKLFYRSENRNDCESLTKVQVEKLEEVYDALEQPSFNDLQYVNLYDLKVFLNLSPEAMERAFRRTGSRDAKEVLHWIASDENVALIFEGEDGDFVILETLLNEIRHDPIEALGVTINSGDTVQEIALEENNDASFNWIHGFIQEECSSSKDEEEDYCVLGNYCSIMNKFHEDNVARILDFEEIEGLLQNVLDEPPEDVEDHFEFFDEDVNNVLDIYDDICTPFCSSNEVDEC